MMECQRRLRPLEIDTYFQLLGVAKGKVKADLYLQGATVINVYTGELQAANVAVKGRHIAYVGPSDEMVGPDTEVADLTGRYLCPGYIEPHCHPFQVYNPDSLARYVLRHGTTTLVNDNMGLYMLVDEATFLRLIDEMAGWPVKMLWSVRLDPQTHADEFAPFFATERIRRLLDHPLVVQAGELTGWPQLLGGDRQMAENLLYALRIGKRVEGHLPGASLETLSMLTAGGITAEHESMTAEEALRRLRIGLWTTLRYSSLRPDLPLIVKGLADYRGNTSRMMLTTDGSTPAFLQDGYTDAMLRVAIESGMEPITAYQMVTINPATYYGLDGEIGGIAPGRLADILVLEDLDRPTPTAVLAEGRWAARDGQLLVSWPRTDWQAFGLGRLQENWRASESDFSTEAGLPVFRMENPAITRLQTSATVDGLRRVPTAAAGQTLQAGTATGGSSTASLTEPSIVAPSDTGTQPDNLLHVALFARDGSSIVEAKIAGMADRLDALASSYTASKGILVMGQNRAAMACAVNRVLEIGGGIVLVEDGQILFELEMPIVGGMSTQDMKHLIERARVFEKLLRERGHVHYDPIYTLLFLSSTHLPEVRLTPQGVLHVKSGRIIRRPTCRTV